MNVMEVFQDFGEVIFGSDLQPFVVGVVALGETVPMVHGEAGSFEIFLELLEDGAQVEEPPFGVDQDVPEGGRGVRISRVVLFPLGLEELRDGVIRAGDLGLFAALLVKEEGHLDY